MDVREAGPKMLHERELSFCSPLSRTSGLQQTFAG